MEREAFLARAAVAVRETDLPDAGTYRPGPLVPPINSVDLPGQFAERLTAVDGICHMATSAADAVRILLDRVAFHRGDEFVSWDQEHLPVAGVLAALTTAGYQRIPTDVGTVVTDRRDRNASFGPLRVGITGADGGLAETGSVVLASGPGRSRMASLVVSVHLVLVRTTSIVASLSHWVAANLEAARDTSNLVVVTGPSRTADIEQRLNLGVHGPGLVEVILTPD